MTIKELFQAFENAVSEEWHKIEPAIKAVAIPLAVDIVEGLKLVVENDPADRIGAIFGSVGAEVEDQAKAILPKVLVDLKIAQNCADQSTMEQTIDCAISALKLSDNNLRNLLYHNIAVMVAHQALQGKIGLGTVISDVQYFYENRNQMSTTPSPVQP